MMLKYMSYLATVMITPMATRTHPKSWLALYLLPRKIIDRRICQTRNVCKIIMRIIQTSNFQYSITCVKRCQATSFRGKTYGDLVQRLILSCRFSIFSQSNCYVSQLQSAWVHQQQFFNNTKWNFKSQNIDWLSLA